MARQQERDEVLQLAIAGIGALERMPALVRALGNLDPDQEAAARRIEGAERQAGVAQREAARRYVHLYEQAITALWTNLEAAIDDLFLECLDAFPSARRQSPIVDISIKVGHYEFLDYESRLRYLREQLKHKQRLDEKAGARRFVSLFGTLGVDTNVSEATARSLCRFWAMRNLLVHRGRVADETYVRRVAGCGDAGPVSVGDDVLADATTYREFSEATADLLAETINGIIERARGLGVPTRDEVSPSADE